MDKLSKIIAHCKCGVHLFVNSHRDIYVDIKEELENMESLGFEIEPDIRAKMIETDTLIDIQAYPETPIGFYKVLHYDLGAALDEMLQALGLATEQSEAKAQNAKPVDAA
jgi:hypothetical protein